MPANNEFIRKLKTNEERKKALQQRAVQNMRDKHESEVELLGGITEATKDYEKHLETELTWRVTEIAVIDLQEEIARLKKQKTKENEIKIKKLKEVLQEVQGTNLTKDDKNIYQQHHHQERLDYVTAIYSQTDLLRKKLDDYEDPQQYFINKLHEKHWILIEKYNFIRDVQDDVLANKNFHNNKKLTVLAKMFNDDDNRLLMNIYREQKPKKFGKSIKAFFSDLFTSSFLYYIRITSPLIEHGFIPYPVFRFDEEREMHYQIQDQVIALKNKATKFHYWGSGLYLVTEHAERIAKAVERSTLLRDFRLGNLTMTPSCFSRIITALKKNLSLERIDLQLIDTTTNIAAIKKQLIDMVTVQLKFNPAIKTLQIAGNRFDNQDVTQLVEALKQNASLTFMSLTVNLIGPEGFKEIADFIKTNKTLSGLALSANFACSDITALQAIRDAMKTNTTLVKLYLESPLARTNKEVAAILKEIQIFCTRNKFLAAYAKKNQALDQMLTFRTGHQSYYEETPKTTEGDVTNALLASITEVNTYQHSKLASAEATVAAQNELLMRAGIFLLRHIDPITDDSPIANIDSRVLKAEKLVELMDGKNVNRAILCYEIGNYYFQRAMQDINGADNKAFAKTAFNYWEQCRQHAGFKLDMGSRGMVADLQAKYFALVPWLNDAEINMKDLGNDYYPPEAILEEIDNKKVVGEKEVPALLDDKKINDIGKWLPGFIKTALNEQSTPLKKNLRASALNKLDMLVKKLREGCETETKTSTPTQKHSMFSWRSAKSVYSPKQALEIFSLAVHGDKDAIKKLKNCVRELDKVDVDGKLKRFIKAGFADPIVDRKVGSLAKFVQGLESVQGKFRVKLR